MLKYLLGCFGYLVLGLNGVAQVLSPLDSYPIQQPAAFSTPRNARTTAAGDTLKLPFFDDFSGYTGKPSTLYWQEAGGVYVNNQFGVRPPSIHVATLEGINEAGLPYSDFASYGITDVLTSKPIFLEGLNTSTDKLVFSFYWQAGGLGGAPDNLTANEPVFLELEFKDRNENWQSVWRQNGENRKTEFAQVVIPVNNAIFLHKGFQFRFRSSGIRRGTGDTWNLDYIYLDKNRDQSKPNLPDVAISRQLTSLLERYTAMPATQFFENPVAELNDSAYTRLNNFNNQFTPITWRGYVKVLSPAAPADTFLRGNAALPPLAQQYLIHGKPNAAAIPNSSNQLRVKHAIFLNTREADARQRQNDTIARITELSDYYAYDDGNAEANFSLNNAGTRVLAYQFELNKSDNLLAIRVYISKTNRPGNSIIFRIWDDNNGQPAATSKAQQAFTIPAVDQLNKFFEIKFANPVPVSGKFYIGFSLGASVSDFVNIGFDLNEQAPNRIFYNNNGTGWLTFTEEKGAIMMRPVLGTITGLREEEAALRASILVYPNPSSGQFTITGAYDNVCLTDLAGKTILCQTRAQTGETLNLSHLAKGIYLLRLTKKQTSITVKLVLIQ